MNSVFHDLDLPKADDRWDNFAWTIAVAIAYVVAAQLGFLLTFENGVASTLWAPTGIALAAFLIRGDQAWAGVLVGCLVAVAGKWGLNFSIIESSILHTVVSLLSARLLTRLCGGQVDLGRFRHIVAFVLVTAVPMALTSANGIAILLFTGAISPDAIFGVWKTWWVGDCAGVIIVAPMILAWHANPSLKRHGVKDFELAIATITLLTAAVFSFSASVSAIYAVFPLILWIALRFSLREGATAVFLVSVIAAVATITGRGAQITSMDDRLTALGLFMTAISITVLSANAWITAQRTAEKARLLASEEQARDSEARFRNAFDFAPFGMALISATGRWLQVNGALRQMLGYSEMELLARDFQSMTHPEDLGMDNALLRSLNAGEVSATQIEKRYVHKTGRIVRVALSVSVVRPRAGVAPYFVCQILDITARIETERARDALIGQLRKLEAIGRVGGWHIDRATNRPALTPGICDILEIGSPEEAVGNPNLKALWTRPEDVKSPELRAALNAAMNDGTAMDLTLETKTATGRPIWLHLKAEPVREGGEITGLSGYAQDVTLQHQLKEKVLSSQKMEAVGQLTAGIAHDFNNLLAAISLNVDLIAQEPSTPSFQKQRAEIAMNACDRGAKLTRQLLAFARKQRLKPVRHDLCALARGSAMLLRSALPTNISVDVIASAALSAWAEIDQAQFDSALLNLGLNAKDAMPDGGLLLISVTTREIGPGAKTLRPGRYAVVAVQDTGAGMPDEVAARAFEPFFTTKEFGRGSGLGLSMVHGFVCQSGGDVEIRSYLGEGTTVEMLFPLAERQGQSQDDASQTRVPVLDGQHKRILLVEDMDDVREACQIQLESLGFEVVPAPTGAAAKRMIAGDTGFDILLTDLDMPGGVDGNRLAESAAAAIPALKIITMTGYNEGRLKNRSERRVSGTRAHLQKPFTRAELEDALRRVMLV